MNLPHPPIKKKKDKKCNLHEVIQWLSLRKKGRQTITPPRVEVCKDVEIFLIIMTEKDPANI